MEEKMEERYLGDIISTDGKNVKNIKARIAKGKGISDKIINLLDTIPFGKHYFEVGIILRNSLLVSSVLFNSEAWYNLTETELNLLETVDLMFLRKLLKAPKGTPKEMLFLELGCMPLREILRERRLGFLHYILKEDPKSMISRFFKVQMEKRNRRDWVTTVLEDLKYLDLEQLSMDSIRKMKKGSFMNLIKKEIRNKTFDKLQSRKKSHTKVENVEHNEFRIQKYLQPNKETMNKEIAQMIFKLRCRVTEAKVNLKGTYDYLDCRACHKEEENQKHILFCPVLNDNRKLEEINYEKLYNGTVSEKVKIAKRFKENFKILDKV
jgi:Zn finger protein HypA/HybF involved in hydrogenase expression